MRTTALPSMLETLARNYNNRNEKAWLYELAVEYIPTTPETLPIEKNTLIAGLYGEDADFFTAKGMVEQLFERLGVINWDIEASSTEYGYHPGRCAVFTIEGEKLGVLERSILPFVKIMVSVAA